MKINQKEERNKMGIHTWDGYFEYENKALKSYIETIERFCSECHTDEDYGGCDRCPTGIFVGQLKKYLIELREIMENYKFRDPKDEKTEFMIRVRKLLKKMPKLHPLYLPRDDETNPDSVFNKLKKLSFEFDLWEKCFDERTNDFFNKVRWRDELKKLKKKKQKNKK